MQTFNEIFKVQVPIMSNDPKNLALIYNKDRSIQFHLEVDDNIDEMMDGEFKKFFHLKGKIDQKAGSCEIEFAEEAKSQNW